MRRIIVVLISAVFLANVGCKKNEAGGLVGITVVNEEGVPIQNVNVSLTVPVENSLEYYGKTDENGYIEFKSGLHVYYDVSVWKGIWQGCDFVELKPGISTLKNVVIYPPNTTFNGCI